MDTLFFTLMKKQREFLLPDYIGHHTDSPVVTGSQRKHIVTLIPAVQINNDIAGQIHQDNTLNAHIDHFLLEDVLDRFNLLLIKLNRKIHLYSPLKISISPVLQGSVTIVRVIIREPH